MCMIQRPSFVIAVSATYNPEGRPVRCGALCRDRFARAAPMIYSSSWGPVELGRKRDVTESYAMTHMQ